MSSSVPLVLGVSSSVRNPLLPRSGWAYCCGWFGGTVCQGESKAVKVCGERAGWLSGYGRAGACRPEPGAGLSLMQA